MQIEAPCVVTLEYEARLEGRVLQHTHGKRAVLIGAERDLPPGLEEALVGRRAGEQFTVTVPNAFGVRDETKVITAQREILPSNALEVGSVFSAQGADGTALEARVIGMDGDTATLDLNHPHAGKALELHVTVHGVRVAEAGELAHGHAHGEGGVHHH